jgi:hypothetical protein
MSNEFVMAGLTRPFTFFFPVQAKTWMAGMTNHRFVVACDKRKAFAQGSASDEAIQFFRLRIASLALAMTVSIGPA